ncbi:TMEM175 family protein [Neptunicella sp. SCSIO 80796]|uniref:TMEM175 family protein n=1 Tax=Neptunicella plasticusilytica TaxID=3117012 RepID=UPI003A4D250B
MIRAHLYNKKLGADTLFRWRGGEVSRIEGFSDGVFAITITLLMVSSSTSDTLFDIWLTVRDLPAFLICFSFVIYTWFEHYRFFRRYGLEDILTICLNSLFLLLVILLAFPLKFLSTFLWYLIIDVDTSSLFVLPEGSNGLIADLTQRKYMMYFYGFSLIGLFGVLALMHLRAFALRKALELDKLEIRLTTIALSHQLVTFFIALLSVSVLAITDNPGVSGIVYFLMPLIHCPLGFYHGYQINQFKYAK